MANSACIRTLFLLIVAMPILLYPANRKAHQLVLPHKGDVSVARRCVANGAALLKGLADFAKSSLST